MVSGDAFFLEINLFPLSEFFFLFFKVEKSNEYFPPLSQSSFTFLRRFSIPKLGIAKFVFDCAMLTSASANKKRNKRD